MSFSTNITATGNLELNEQEMRAFAKIAEFGAETFIKACAAVIPPSEFDRYKPTLSKLFDRLKETCCPAVNELERMRRDINEANRLRVMAHEKRMAEIRARSSSGSGSVVLA